MSKWEVGKRYKTRYGGEATVFMTDGRGGYPIIGVVHGHGIDSEASWLTDGSHHQTGVPHPFDLMPPEPRMCRGYLNLYPDGRGFLCPTRGEADAAAGRSRLECREITWPAEPSPC